MIGAVFLGKIRMRSSGRPRQIALQCSRRSPSSARLSHNLDGGTEPGRPEDVSSQIHDGARPHEGKAALSWSGWHASLTNQAIFGSVSLLALGLCARGKAKGVPATEMGDSTRLLSHLVILVSHPNIEQLSPRSVYKN